MDDKPKYSRVLNEHGLTGRQEAFCIAYVNNAGNGTQAAIEAGYPVNGAHTRAYEALRSKRVQARLETLTRTMMGSYAAGCVAVLYELAVSSPSDTVRQAAASSLLDRTGYKAPVVVEVSDTRTQQDVDRELAALLGLDSLDQSTASDGDDRPAKLN